MFVNGGLTRWKIEGEAFGKNCGRYWIYAMRLDTKETITIQEGRRRYLEGHEYKHMMAERGTLLARIFAKAVKDGNAEWIRGS